MNSSDLLCLKHKSTRPTFARGSRLSLVLAVICFCGLQTARAQNSYSDMWIVDAPSAVQTMTDEEAEPPVDEVNSDYARLASAGITESVYTDYNYYQSKSTLKSPLGSAASYTGPWGSYSRADVSLNVSLLNTEAGDYVLETVHTKSTSPPPGSPGGPGLEMPYMTNHSSKTKYRGPSTSAATPKPGIFSWIGRLIGSIRPFKIVYKYSSQLQVGTEMRYYYSLVCQRPDCRADTIKSFPSNRFGGMHPPYVVIRGVKASVNLLVTRVHACVGRAFAAYFQETC